MLGPLASQLAPPHPFSRLSEDFRAAASSFFAVATISPPAPSRRIIASTEGATALAHHALNNLPIDFPRPVQRQLGRKVDPTRMGVGRTIGEADEVIMSHSTRKRLSRGLAMLRNKKLENPRKKHDNIPL
jgi:hypothetical protein